MIELKIKNTTVILPPKGDKLVLKLRNENNEVTGHIECDRVTVMRNGSVTADQYESVKHTMDVRSIAYPNNGELCVPSPKGEYVHILIHKSNGSEWVTEEIVSRFDEAMNVRITSLKAKTKDVPCIKGFDGDVKFPSTVSNYRILVGYSTAGTRRTTNKNGNFPGKLRSFNVSMIEYNRIEDTQVTEFGIQGIYIDRQDKVIIEPMGYEYNMNITFPVNAAGGTNTFHELNWIMVNG